jgi:hypothetical protein
MVSATDLASPSNDSRLHMNYILHRAFARYMFYIQLTTSHPSTPKDKSRTLKRPYDLPNHLLII